MSIKKNYHKIIKHIKKLEDLPLLFMRIILSIGFYGPAMMKIKNFNGIIEWFTNIGIPLPTLNAYMATATENIGFVLLFLGLGTRIIAIPLMVTMVVAIVTVHLANGFEAGNNGFEIPLYYLIMLFTLLIYGSGKYSLDYLLNKNKS